MAHTETRNEKLDLRLTPSAKRMLQTAALAAHRSVSEFVLESALARVPARSPALRVERRSVGSLSSRPVRTSASVAALG